MNGGGSDWQTRARRLAATMLIVAVALCVTVNVVRQVLPFLVISAALIAAIYLVVAAIQARRNRW